MIKVKLKGGGVKAAAQVGWAPAPQGHQLGTNFHFTGF